MSQESMPSKANCFDNFTDDGRYINTVCECDINKGYIQTEDKGFGEDGCFAVPENTPTKLKHQLPVMENSLKNSPRFLLTWIVIVVERRWRTFTQNRPT